MVDACRLDKRLCVTYHTLLVAFKRTDIFNIYIQTSEIKRDILFSFLPPSVLAFKIKLSLGLLVGKFSIILHNIALRVVNESSSNLLRFLFSIEEK
jgi:hypothetical protein